MRILGKIIGATCDIVGPIGSFVVLAIVGCGTAYLFMSS